MDEIETGRQTIDGHQRQYIDCCKTDDHIEHRAGRILLQVTDRRPDRQITIQQKGKQKRQQIRRLGSLMSDHSDTLHKKHQDQDRRKGHDTAHRQDDQEEQDADYNVICHQTRRVFGQKQE